MTMREDRSGEDALLARAFPAATGAPVDATIHPRCDMMRYLVESGASDVPAFAYLRSGREALMVVRHVTNRCGKGLDGAGRVLDFASGYGRLTRFLVHEGPEVWASDIDKDAVRFVADTFGARAFASSAQPDRVELPGPFDLIFVGSLFSHLPLHRFLGWLARLLDALAPDGLLVFSTHGYGVSPEVAKDPSGFTFVPRSESSRLPREEYGSSFVTRRWVESALLELGIHRMLCAERDLWERQDVYAVRVGDGELPPSLGSAPFCRGRVEKVDWPSPQHLWVGGYCTFPASALPLLRIEVHGEQGHIGDAVMSEAKEIEGVGPCRDALLAVNWYAEGPVPASARLLFTAVTPDCEHPIDAIDLGLRRAAALPKAGDGQSNHP